MILAWRVDGEASGAGQVTNLLVCRESLAVVPVVPFPKGEVWAPANLCGGDAF
jgi:hypothetical protein